MYLIKSPVADCFIAFPSTCSVYSTQISFKNILKQLKVIDPKATAQVTYQQTEKKLIVNIVDDKLNNHPNVSCDIKQSEYNFSLNAERVSVEQLVDSFEKLFIWSLKIDKQKYRVTIEFENNHLKVKVHEVKDIVQKKSEKLLLIDGSNLLHIGYFATKGKALKNSEGLYTSGVLVFARTFLNLVKQLQPTHVTVCWDKEGGNTFRKSLYPAYKAHRKKKEIELIQQLHTTREMLAEMNVMQFESQTYEADDLIGTLSKKWSSEKKRPCYIISNDKDLYQLLNECVVQVTVKQSQSVIISQKKFEKEYGISPMQWIDVKGLLGDTSDNISGCKGVGNKGCFPLIQQYKSIEVLYKRLEELKESDFKRYYQLLLNGKEDAFLSKTLATIIKNVPDVDVDLDSLRLNVNKKSMISEFQRLQFKSLLQQLNQGMYRIS